MSEEYLEDDIAQAHEEMMVQLTKEVEGIVAKDGISHIEQIVEICEKHGLDEYNIQNLISPSLLEKIHTEARDLRLIKRTGVSLPL